MTTIRVNLGPRSYDIAIGCGVAEHFAAFVCERVPQRSQSLVVADANVHGLADRIAGSLQSKEIATVPSGESSKSLIELERLYGRLANMAADRKTCVIAVGGGVVGDLAGFTAATYNRGLRLVMVPTTLLAMVDSSVGGKVGINLPHGKNLVGAFHQPSAVWIDTRVLETLPEREYRSGLAEVVKYGVILDPELFAWLELHAKELLSRDPSALAHVVARSCQLKASVVERDEREESGLRMALNFGHTFAHAFETVAGYGIWLHGEAVAAGMMHAARLASRRGLIATEVVERLKTLLRQLELPTARHASWNSDELLTAMRRDKKNQDGRLRFILPTELGHVRLFDDVTEAEVREALAIE